MSLIFNGSTDYVSITSVVLSGADSSIEMGFNFNAVGGMFVGKSDDVDTYIYLLNTTTIRIQTDVTATVKSFTVPTMSTNTWYHLIVTRESNTTKVYLNATESSSGGQSQSDDLTIDQIGKYHNGSSLWYSGIMDDVRIWDRALSLEEITNCYTGTAPRNGLVAEWLMNEGSGSTAYDTSVNSNDGTITGATWGNDFTSNPWIIKAAASGDVSTSLPTYNGNTGVHVAYGIVAIYWTGATATHVCEVKDASAERIWKSVCTTTNIEPKFKLCEPIVIKGLNISTLESGTLYIYHT